MRLIVLFFYFSAICLFGQSTDFIIKGGTLHTGNGAVIENAIIVCEKGKIVSVSQIGKTSIDSTSKKVYNFLGKHIYPGLISMYSSIGLNEIEAVRATQDHTEVGNLNPNIRSLIAYNTDSEIIPTVRSAGILFAQIVPRGGLISCVCCYL